MKKKWNDVERFWRDESDKMTESQKIRLKIATMKGMREQLSLTESYARDKENGMPVALCAIPVPDWPEKIADAWELVEEIATSGYFVKITTPTDLNEPYLVKIDEQGWGDSNPPPPGGWWSADSASLAICLAYIQWKESQK